jgi:hypothetical protein
MFVGQTMNELLCNLVGKDVAQAPGFDAFVFKNICQGKGVYHGSKHAHMVRCNTVDAVTGYLGPADYIAAADHYRDLLAFLGDFFDFAGQPLRMFGIKTAVVFSRQLFA